MSGKRFGFNLLILVGLGFITLKVFDLVFYSIMLWMAR